MARYWSGGAFTTINGTSRTRIARLHPNGSTDESFDPGAGGSGGEVGETSVHAIAIQGDGKVIVGGSYTTFDGVPRTRLARLHANGSLDSTFDPGSGANGTVRSIAMQADGNILIGGDFTEFDGVPWPYVARLFGVSPPPTSFAAWAANHGLEGSEAADDADPDGDGLANALEYPLGGSPVLASASGSPRFSLTSGSMIFTFKREDASETPDLALTVQSGSDLLNWPAVFTVGATTATSSPGVSVIENGTAADTVTVTIARGANPRWFVRLKAMVAR